MVVVGPPRLFGAPNLAQLAGMCVFVDMYVFVCGEHACSSVRVPACRSLYAQPQMCRCAQAYAAQVSLQTRVPSLSPCLQEFPPELQASPEPWPHLGPGAATSGYCG